MPIFRGSAKSSDGEGKNEKKEKQQFIFGTVTDIGKLQKGLNPPPPPRELSVKRVVLFC